MSQIGRRAGRPPHERRARAPSAPVGRGGTNGHRDGHPLQLALAVTGRADVQGIERVNEVEREARGGLSVDARRKCEILAVLPIRHVTPALGAAALAEAGRRGGLLCVQRERGGCVDRHEEHVDAHENPQRYASDESKGGAHQRHGATAVFRTTRVGLS